MEPSNPDDEKSLSPPGQETALTSTTNPESSKKAVTKKTIIRKKRRPARPQVDASSVKTGEIPAQTGTVFNIWYNKWSGGDREDKYLSKHHAEGRCDVARDSGYTRADQVAGSYFCLFFARGLCPKGHECEYLHRLPTIHDLFNPNIDCFGRDKHSDYRDDMGGVGSFMRQNRTLYVGRVHVSDDIEEVVARHFAEWGQVERIRVLNSRGVAFVTYSNEANSQFAKEAMAHQSLDHNEILNVRWATVDPNPMAQAREARKIEEQAAEAVRRALPAEFVAEIEGRDPEARKRKRIEGSFGLQGYEAPDEVWFARTKEMEDGGQEPSLRIEEGSREEKYVGAEGDGVGRGGLLSSSTLAALKGFTAQSGGMGRTSQLSGAGEGGGGGGGPLVAYGSEDDSD
ncbi:MAG: Pre-mRNA-splicing factor [Peltula sp. TS41687]|nr:MAG: Pre-mRNA-splicing factor [Peltula sp. TS41687]